jgi:predicted DNA-binding helix-hairpin-helix protein
LLEALIVDLRLTGHSFLQDRAMVSISRSYREMEIDSKLAWALEHREQFPVDLNRAPREMLLRIPGVGPRTAERILQTRQRRPIVSADVRKQPLNWHQLRYFVATSDHRPRQLVPSPEERGASLRGRPLSQLELFGADTSRLGS